MRRPRFDEFVNFYDKETQGKYAYYYRSFWDACRVADAAYIDAYKKSVWETKDYSEWVRSFEKFIKEQLKEEVVKASVCEKVEEWIKVI